LSPRTLERWRWLGLFAARIMVEPASSPQYKDANKLANVVLPGEPPYAAAMRGESVQPDVRIPISIRKRGAESVFSPPTGQQPYLTSLAALSKTARRTQYSH
jgi:hypothetical protein